MREPGLGAARRALGSAPVHTDCPEFNAAGFIVPGQTRKTDPLTRLVRCGFHDHLHESDSRFVGKVAVETR